MISTKDLPTISIITPVYNVAEYLHACVESIMTQTYSAWELLLIDDGSSDDSGTICDYYASCDSRINCIFQTNRGPSAARNKGLSIANGEYIAFVDADDVLLSSHYLSILYNTLSIEDADISICLSKIFSKSTPYLRDIDDSYTYELVSGPSFCSHKYEDYNAAFGSSWGKLFRRRLFDHIRFPENLIVAEDNAIAHRLYYPCKQIALINQRMYGYRNRHTGQHMRVDTRRQIEDIESAFSDRVSYYLEHGRDDLANYAQLEKRHHIARAIINSRLYNAGNNTPFI